MKQIPKLKINIKNNADKTAEIDIDGEIGWINEAGEWNTASSIKSKLKEISELDVSKITVNINSLGGFVDDGLAIHDILASHKAEIETRVTGLTASAATIIAQAGDKRTMSDNALYLVHQAWGFGMGNANDMMAVAADLEAIDKRILNIYAKRSKATKDIKALMGEDNGNGKWIDAGEAKEFGLIDEIFEPMKAAASVDIKSLKNSGLPIPEKFKDQVTELKNETKDLKTEVTINSDEFFAELDKRIAKMEQISLDGSEIKKQYDNLSEKEIPEGIDFAELRNREASTLIN